MDIQELRELTAHIVSAYVEKNPIPVAELSSLVASVSTSIAALENTVPAPAEAPKPAVNPKKSVHNDHIVCLEDGKRFKSLKRHLGGRARPDPRRIPREVGIGGRLPDGRARLCRCALRVGEEDRVGTGAKGQANAQEEIVLQSIPTGLRRFFWAI